MQQGRFRCIITSMEHTRIGKASSSYFRNFVFGVEDSLVSTVGLLSGVAIAGVARGTILLTGVVLIFVEAFSMAAGSFLSEYSAEEYESKKVAALRLPLTASLVMFISYFVSGFIPLFPYVFWDTTDAFKVSIGFSLAALFLLGIFGARLSGRSLLKGGVRMLIIGGTATLIGIFAGQISQALGIVL